MTNLNRYRVVRPLTESEIREKAPSVYAESAAEVVSEKYTFIPTTQVIEDMESFGWKVYSAEQRSARTKVRNNFTKHLLRFRNDSIESIHGCYPEITLTNSHDGRNAFQFYVGLYSEDTKSSFLIGGRSVDSLRIKHQWYTLREVREITQKVVDYLPIIIEQIGVLHNTNVDIAGQRNYISSMLRTRWGSEYPNIIADLIVDPIRKSDVTLWDVFKRVQDNVLNGGITYTLPSKRKQTVRAITNVDLKININQQLWEVTQDYIGKLQSTIV
jgi:hypothetical protein